MASTWCLSRTVPHRGEKLQLVHTYKDRLHRKLFQLPSAIAGTTPSVLAPTTQTITSTGKSPDAATATLQPLPFVWERHWVPVSPVSYLDPSRPAPVMLLGQQLVLWHHANRGWVVMRDVCPHRLAPLSEGRLEAGGTRLACAYHGWEFNDAGACTRVPQLAGDKRAAATACASQRSAVTSFPTKIMDGVLFVWLDASKEGLRVMEAAPPLRLLDERATTAFDWFMSEMPCDYSFWLEQGMDPTHANFLHHGVGGFRQSDYLAMESKVVKGLDVAKGWRWEHGAYEKKQLGMKGQREFVPPFTNRFHYPVPKSGTTYYCTMIVPVRPGVCRTFFKFGFGSGPTGNPEPASAPAVGTPSNGSGHGTSSNRDAPAASASKSEAAAPASRNGANPVLGIISGMMRRLPHWAVGSQLIGDQDIVMMCRQERLMRSQRLTYRDYNLNSGADAGVAATNRWLSLAGYPTSLWGHTTPVSSGQTFSSWPSQDLSLEDMLSREQRHVRHCATCQEGLRLVTRICTALTAAAVVAGSVATVLTIVAVLSPQGMAGIGGWATLVGAAVIVVGLAAAAVKGWEFREERFISGAAQWRRIGGFTLLGMKIR